MWKPSARSKFAGRQLATLPKIFFEVDDKRPDDSDGQENPAVMFTTGSLAIPLELNGNVLKFLAGEDLLSVAGVSEVTSLAVWDYKGLLFDAVRAQLDGLREFPVSLSRTQRGVNLHGFKKKNRVSSEIDGVWVDGYIVAVTKKYIHYVRYDNVFDAHPPSIRVKSERGVVHVHPYIGDITEVVQHWQVDPRFGGRQICSYDGCTKWARNGGVCITHSHGGDAV